MAGARGAISFLCVIAGLGAAAAQPASEVFVLNHGTADISIVDPVTSSVLPGTIDVSDPDGDGTIDRPADLCASTLVAEPGTKVFVVQGRLLSVVDAATRTLTGPVWDLAALTGLPGAVGRGCAASRPRRFQDPAGPEVVRAHLHVALDLPGGAPHFAVLDQAQLLLAAGVPLVATGPLAPAGSAHDVTVLDLPAGPRFERAWYTVTPPGEVGAVLVAGDVSGLIWQVEASRFSPLPVDAPPFQHLQPGRPPCRELPVGPEGALGRVRNLEADLACDLPGEIVAAHVTGPGPNSFTLFALDGAGHQLHVLEPDDCATLDSVPTGAAPVAVVTLGAYRWRSAFVANHDDDTLTRVDDDGAASTIPLGSTPPGACVRCPIALAVTQTSGCQFENLRLAKVDLDNDGREESIRLTWDGNCGRSAETKVACACTQPGPCECHCIQCGAPECLCPGFGTLAAGFGLGPGAISILPPWPINDEPWKELGTSFDNTFDHVGALDAPGSFAYGLFPPP